MKGERAKAIAQFAHAFGRSMAEVRAMTLRDIEAMSSVLVDEAQERARQADLARRKQARRQ